MSEDLLAKYYQKKNKNKTKTKKTRKFLKKKFITGIKIFLKKRKKVTISLGKTAVQIKAD